MEMSTNPKNTRPFPICMAASITVLLGASLFLTSPQIAYAKADPDSANNEFLIVRDENGKDWSETNEVNIFANDEFGGRAIVAPYSKGSYSFSVENTARFPIDCDFSFSIETNASEENAIPFEYRLKDNNGYVVGGDDKWVDISGLDFLSKLSYESDNNYTLEWQWDGDVDDERDTALGIKAAQAASGYGESMEYILKISCSAEQSGDAVGSDQPDNPLEPDNPSNPTEPNNPSNPSNPNNPSNPSNSVAADGSQNPPLTGDNKDIVPFIALGVCSAAAIGLTLIIRHKHDDEYEEFI